MANHEPLKAKYSKIPDHSDLRGFLYRAPSNYEWTDDHGKSSAYGARDLWSSVKSFLGKGPKGYRRSDERIREDICEALLKHPGIDASEIEVRVANGAVTLIGTVPDRWMKRASEWLIDRVSGVESVHNHLQPEDQHRPRLPH